MVEEKEEKEVKEDERFCFKCKNIVNKINFNAYYDICDKCVG